MLKAIVAVCDDWGIGLDGRLLVDNREDMRHFVRSTRGGVVIMGRKTLESFPGGRPLRGRHNIVVSSRDDYEVPACGEDTTSVVVGDLDAALAAAMAEAGTRGCDAWVIGGESIYRQLLPSCGEVVVTKNHVTLPADSFFPNLDEDPEWQVISTEPGGTTSEGVTFEYVTYRRV